jgi:hypothetical protein
VDFYNLDAIIAVGYRVNSIEATPFSPQISGLSKKDSRKPPLFHILYTLTLSLSTKVN